MLATEANDSAPMSVIGKPRARVDGPLKVSGRAMYTSDYNFPDALYAVPVGSTIAKGEALQIDTAEAGKMPGERAIYTRDNIGKHFRESDNPSAGAEGARRDERRPPFEDDVIRYYGQYVALVVAETFEEAK